LSVPNVPFKPAALSSNVNIGFPVIVLEVAFLAVFWTWGVSAVLFLRNTYLPRMPLMDTPQRHDLPAITVHFQATDGQRLEGWNIPADPSRPWIILCHGVGSNRADLLDIAAALHAAQFNLLLFDFRGHGGSAGRSTSFGWREQRDVEGALAFLGQQPDVPPRPYGIYGISMGAAVAFMVASRDERLAAVAADSPYRDLEAALGRHLALMYPLLPRVPFLWFILITYRIRFGVWPSTVSPQASARTISPRSLLLIQGGSDARVLPDEARSVFAAAGEPRTLWIVEGAGHLESFASNPDVYLERVTAFFEASLGG